VKAIVSLKRSQYGRCAETYQNFLARKSVIPSLTIAIHGTTPIDLDILSAPDNPSDALLEGIVEIVGLPILDIISELQLSVELEVDIFEKAQV
jgi:hypothetical protein